MALEGAVGGGGGVLGGLSLRICVVGVVGEVHVCEFVQSVSD